MENWVGGDEISTMEQVWWDKYKVDVPEGHIGDWAVERFEITDDGAKLYNLQATLHGFGYRSVRPGIYTCLTRNGNIVMSDTQAEIRDHLEIIRKAKGDVLLNGLGLGLVLRACLLKPGVNHVTVVEIAPEVITLVEPHLCKQFGDRFIVHEADALTWKAPKNSRWDVVWHDIFDAICTDNLSTMTKLKRRYGNRCDWQGCWAEYEHRRR